MLWNKSNLTAWKFVSLDRTMKWMLVQMYMEKYCVQKYCIRVLNGVCICTWYTWKFWSICHWPSSFYVNLYNTWTTTHINTVQNKKLCINFTLLYSRKCEMNAVAAASSFISPVESYSFFYVFIPNIINYLLLFCLMIEFWISFVIQFSSEKLKHREREREKKKKN